MLPYDVILSQKPSDDNKKLHNAKLYGRFFQFLFIIYIFCIFYPASVFFDLIEKFSDDLYIQSAHRLPVPFPLFQGQSKRTCSISFSFASGRLRRPRRWSAFSFAGRRFRTTRF
jgi:hypothetical protein